MPPYTPHVIASYFSQRSLVMRHWPLYSSSSRTTPPSGLTTPEFRILTPKGGETLVSRIKSGVPVAEAARQMGVSCQTVGKWLRRGRSGEGLRDRNSSPHRLASLTPPASLSEQERLFRKRDLMPDKQVFVIPVERYRRIHLHPPFPQQSFSRSVNKTTATSQQGLTSSPQLPPVREVWKYPPLMQLQAYPHRRYRDLSH